MTICSILCEWWWWGHFTSVNALSINNSSLDDAERAIKSYVSVTIPSQCSTLPAMQCNKKKSSFECHNIINETPFNCMRHNSMSPLMHSCKNDVLHTTDVKCSQVLFNESKWLSINDTRKNITLSWLVSATIAIEQFSIIIDREN